MAKLPPIERPLELTLNLTKLTILRRLTLRMPFSQASTFERDPFFGTLSTITSPTFCELVIELLWAPFHFDGSPVKHWGHWEVIDEFIAENFAHRGDFRLIIRVNWLYDQETFRMHAMEIFRSSTKKGCIRFETTGR